MNETLKIQAQNYFRGVYSGQPEVVDNLAAPEIYATYPVFEQLFNTPALRGRKALREFAIGFGQRWRRAIITFHEIIQEGNQVVLIWSFEAVRVESDQEHRWGGITLIKFNEFGKVIAEIGEESTPGPMGRAIDDAKL